MPIERSGTRYTGPKLFPDSKGVIYDTDIAKLPIEVKKVYLNGGYHSLVNRVFNGHDFEKLLSAEKQAYLRTRLIRELIDCTTDAHKDRAAVNSLINYFDRKAYVSLYLELSLEARRLAETYVCSNVDARDLREKPSAQA